MVNRVSRDKFTGRVRIGMIQTIAPYLLPAIIGDLARTHPELDLHVREAQTTKLLQELSEGRLDTVILALPVSEPSLTEVAMFAENFLLVRPDGDTGKPVPSAAARSRAAQSPSVSMLSPVSRQPRPPSKLASPSRSASAAASCMTGIIEVRTVKPPA